MLLLQSELNCLVSNLGIILLIVDFFLRTQWNLQLECQAALHLPYCWVWNWKQCRNFSLFSNNSYWNNQYHRWTIKAIVNCNPQKFNQVVIWDKIIRRGESATIDYKDIKAKYYFFDDGHGLRLGFLIFEWRCFLKFVQISHTI